jgi:hypothetical protein
MKRLFVVVVVLALVVVGWGFYRGWFALSRSDGDKGDNKVNVNLTVDGDKMQDDAEAVKKRTTELTESVTGGERTPSDQATENVKSKDR